ncbi:hypothetical protein RclHR1_00250026 [Rhizophagus clarus]|uniref:Uncharacterized protein n=1 Tax=Rhizophagus clarus TaxID=94130 RepID=A0A2Z6RTG5_9GLOM|nr:hypothetical protein RclHR1_00250026 [Rhizophagus clarus]GET00984.1 hypothetical protein GLOIN_2v1841914 [Rhizophagus clarus]
MTSNTFISETQFKEYEDTLKLFGDENCLLYNYALYETKRLMENSIGRSNGKIEDKKVVNFAIKVAKHLSNYQWTHYNDSTIAHLELFLDVMSSVLYILSQSVEMINTDIRTSFYKSVSKFWTTYRNTNEINANVMFRLREIRNCLRKIKDDQTNLDIAVSTGGKVIESTFSAVQGDYLQAFSSLTTVLDFEYSAGKWYDDWREMHETYFTLRQQSSEDLEGIKQFSKILLKSSIDEFEKVKKKNTAYRNVEYKVLKSGGELLGYSLPDNIDTLLIGYLHLMQRVLEEFFLHIKKYIKKIVPFCNEIIETHVKKQLTFKAVEVLYVIKQKAKKKYKDEIEVNFSFWSNASVASAPMTKTSSSSSRLSSYSTLSVDSIDSTLLTPDTPGKKKARRSSFQKVMDTLSNPQKVIDTLSNPQKDQQQRKQIIEGVKKLFEGRRKIKKNIEEIKMGYSKLENETVNKDKHLILSKLNEIFKEKRNNERKDNIEYIKSVQDKVIDELILSKLKEVLEGEYEKKDEIELILTKLQEILEGNRKKRETSSNLLKLKEILERGIEESKVVSVEEVSTTERSIEESESFFIKEPSSVEEWDSDNDDREEFKFNVSTTERSIEESELFFIKEPSSVEEWDSDNDDREEFKFNVSTTERNIEESEVPTITDDTNDIEWDSDDDDREEFKFEKNDSEDVILPVNPVNIVINDDNDVQYVNDIKDLSNDIVYLDNREVIFGILDYQKYLDDDVIISDNADAKEVKDVNIMNNVNGAKDVITNLIEEFDDTLYIDNYEIIFDVDEILLHQKYLDDDVITSDNADAKDVKDMNIMNNANGAKDVITNLIEEFDDTLYINNYEIIFDVDEILHYQKYLDDHIIISDNAAMSDVKSLPKIPTNQYNNYNLIEEFDDTLYLDNHEIIIFDIDEILSYQNYLDDVVISDKTDSDKIDSDKIDSDKIDSDKTDKAVADTNDSRILSNISVENYYYSFEEETDDNLYLVDYNEELSPPPPYSEKSVEKDDEKDDDVLIALKESLPSPYNECDISELKNMLPPNYNKLDSITIVNVIQKNYIINVQQKNNVQDEEESSFFRTFKKIIKEVEILVDKAVEAHQAAVNKEKLRRSSNLVKPELTDKEKEVLNASK